MDVFPDGFVDGCLGGELVNLVISPIPYYLDNGRAAPLYLSAGIVNLPPERLVMLLLDDCKNLCGCLVASFLSCYFDLLKQMVFFGTGARAL